MQHVYGHAEDYLSVAAMSPAQRVNCWADKLATVALIAAVEANEYILSIFPSEKYVLKSPGNKSSGLPKMQSLSSGENK